MKNLKKKAAILLAAFTLTLPAAKSEAAVNNSNKVVYFVPHADDEVLTFGPSIREDIRQKKQVYLVLASHGEGSGAIKLINGELYCNLHKTTHTHENVHLTKEQFGNARVQDFKKVTNALGIPATNIYIHSLVNGKFAYSQTKSMEYYYISKFRGAEFKTMSPLDYHEDHAMLGKALVQLEKDKRISPDKTKYYVSIYTDRFSKIRIPYRKYQTWANSTDIPKMKAAISVYSTWDPKRGLYATGTHSVNSQFNSISRHMYSTFYK